MCACDKEEEKYKREVRVGEERSNESGGQTERRDREGESWRRIDNTAPILRAASPMQALSTFKMHYVDVLKPKEWRCTHEFSEGRINCPTGWIFVELGLDRRGHSVSTLVLFLGTVLQVGSCDLLFLFSHLRSSNASDGRESARKVECKGNDKSDTVTWRTLAYVTTETCLVYREYIGCTSGFHGCCSSLQAR